MCRAILVLLALFPIFTYAQLDSVYTFSGEVYVGKVEQYDNNIQIISKGNARITLEKKYVQNIVISKPLVVDKQIESYNEFNNPDGNKVSIHFTPFFFSGNLTINDGNTTNSYDYDKNFNIEIMIKIPINNLTFSPFYRSYTDGIKFPDNTSQKVSGNFFGCTMSYYLK